MGKDIFDTPLMRQYSQIKAKHPDAILLFRVGDFYETYCEDAVKAAKILNSRSPRSRVRRCPLIWLDFRITPSTPTCRNW